MTPRSPLLDSLNPESLGMLLALYEHRTHAAGVLWGINSFDQWGVELGKRIARDLLPALEGRAASVEIGLGGIEVGHAGAAIASGASSANNDATGA